MTLLLGSLQVGLIYGLMALGVYLSFRVLNVPDLSAEGTFTFGLAVSAALTVAGHPALGIPLGMLAGALGGAVTGLLQTKVGVHPILAGILTMSGLYSIDLLVLGSGSNLSLVGMDTLFRLGYGLLPGLDKDVVKLLISALFTLGGAGLLALFFKTHVGLCIRATGDNEAMVRASSIDVHITKILALAISNGCIGLSGALLAQYQGFADINSGVGIVAVGLASVIIGEGLLGRRGVAWGLLTTVAGSLLYRLMIALALKSSLFPAYFLKLISAVIVAVALAVPVCREGLRWYAIKRAGLKRSWSREEGERDA